MFPESLCWKPDLQSGNHPLSDEWVSNSKMESILTLSAFLFSFSPFNTSFFPITIQRKPLNDMHLKDPNQKTHEPGFRDAKAYRFDNLAPTIQSWTCPTLDSSVNKFLFIKS